MGKRRYPKLRGVFDDSDEENLSQPSRESPEAAPKKPKTVRSILMELLQGLGMSPLPEKPQKGELQERCEQLQDQLTGTQKERSRIL